MSEWTSVARMDVSFGREQHLEEGPVEAQLEGAGEAPVDSLPPSTVRTFFLEGELGQVELRQVGDELERLFRLGELEVILDLADVGHLDYRGVRALVKRVEALRKLGFEVKLSAVSPYLLAILRVSGAHGVFEVYDGPEKARQAFEEQAQRR